MKKIELNSNMQVGDFVKLIKNCHEDLFPDATLLTQCEKFKEEYEEFKQSDYKDVKELADLFIVACGIYRFNEAVGQCLCKSILSDFYEDDLKLSAFVYIVINKMNKNIDKVWDNKDGYYHHVSSIN